MRRLLWGFAIFLLLPIPGYAQEATVTGTVVDPDRRRPAGSDGDRRCTRPPATRSSRSPMSAASIDCRCASARTGCTMELPGFANVAERFEALVGQTLTVNAQMRPSTVQESVTVTGEAPLIRDDVLDARGQHRSAADEGSSGQRRQLARPVTAGAGQPIERRGSELRRRRGTASTSSSISTASR